MNPDFADMLSALSAAGVEFLVVGAYALAAHGLPRATGDIDILVRPERENAKRVMHALQVFGAPLVELDLADLLRDDTVFQIGVSPTRIDIMTGISGVSFDEAWRGRLEVPIAGRPIAVIGLAELLRNKEATGRPKDQADVVWLRGKIEK